MKILFLDLEGVVTIGMLSAMRPIWQWRNDVDGVYSSRAAELLKKLATEHDVRIVLITRHGKNEGAILQRRLNNAGIDSAWLYNEDPDAIADYHQTKGDAVVEWLARNPKVKPEDTAALEDHPEELNGYPEDRIVAVNGARGMVRADYLKLLSLYGIIAPIPAPPAIGSPATPKL